MLQRLNAFLANCKKHYLQGKSLMDTLPCCDLQCKEEKDNDQIKQRYIDAWIDIKKEENIE